MADNIDINEEFDIISEEEKNMSLMKEELGNLGNLGNIKNAIDKFYIDREELIKSLQSKILILEETNKELSCNLSKQTFINNSLCDENLSLKEKLEAFNKENKTLRDNFNSCQGVIKTNNEFKVKVLELEKSIEGKDNEIEKIKKYVNNYSDYINKLDNKIEKLKKELKEKEIKIQELMNKLDNPCEFKLKVAELEKSIEDYKKENNELKKLNEKFNKETNKIVETRVLINSYQTEIERLEKVKNDNEKLLKENEDLIKSLIKDNDDNKKKLLKIKKFVNTL